MLKEWKVAEVKMEVEIDVDKLRVVSLIWETFFLSLITFKLVPS